MSKLFTVFIAIHFLNGAFAHASCRPEPGELSEPLVEWIDYRPSQSWQAAVVILPPTGGATFLDRQYATALCRAGLRAVLLMGWQGDDEVSMELEVHNRLFERAQTALGQFLKWSGEERVGVLGTSVGALHAANALGVFNQVKAGFLVAGGAPIAELIATSSEETLTQVRRQRMQEFGWSSVDQYQAALTTTLSPEWEPMGLGDLEFKKPVSMVVALDDDTVPTPLQRNLADALEAFPVHEFSGGHVWGIIKAWWFLEDEMRDFFIKHLGA